MLKANVIWPESRRFKSRTEWEPIGFFSEALCNATQFDLKLGFFSSSAINVLSDGFATFLYNGGKMRMIINDILSDEDKKTIINGQSSVGLMSNFNLDDFENIKGTLSERDQHFLECLAWLIRNERLEIKIIRPDDSDGIAHSKIGLFSDGLNKVAFDGSCNFSRTALIENRESISAFCDWDGHSDVLRICDIEAEFELTFTEKDKTVKYIDPENIRTRISSTFQNKDIRQLLYDEERLIEEHSKMELPRSIVLALNRAKAKTKALIYKINETYYSRRKESKACFPIRNAT